MASKIQLRRDSRARWLSFNPVLFLGEAGVESDTGRIKVGNGVDDWLSLPYSGATHLNELADVVLATVQDGQALIYDAGNSQWTAGNVATSGGVTELAALTDVDVSLAQADQVLKYDAGNAVWVAGNVAPGATVLSDLADVSNTSPVDNQVLTYDAGNTIWVAGNVTPGVQVLNELTDVVVDLAQNGEFLKYDAGNTIWVPGNVEVSGGASILDDLDDVVIDAPLDGEFIRYDSVAGIWVNTAPGFPEVLNDLTDVSTSEELPGDVLTYNGFQWTNTPAPSGGGGGMWTFDPTIQEFDFTAIPGTGYLANPGLGNLNVTLPDLAQNGDVIYVRNLASSGSPFGVVLVSNLGALEQMGATQAEIATNLSQPHAAVVYLDGTWWCFLGELTNFITP